MKDYVILMDSVGDFTQEQKQLEELILVPLTMRIDDEEFVADYNLDLDELLLKIKNSKSCPKTACPAPGVYLELFEKYKDKRIYVVNVSHNLSGCYNSAIMAKEMFLDDYEDASITIFDSLSASAGQGLIVESIVAYEEARDSLESITEKINKLIENIHTVFVLEDLTFLEKNGRLTGLTKVLSNALHICPVLHGPNGEIMMKDKAIGAVRALNKMCDIIVEDIKNTPVKSVFISHCNALKKAEKVKETIQKEFSDIKVIIAKTGPCATLYAGDKGVVVSY